MHRPATVAARHAYRPVGRGGRLRRPETPACPRARRKWTVSAVPVAQRRRKRKTELERLLDQYPPSLRACCGWIRRSCPTRPICSRIQRWSAFLAQHPEIEHNPLFFLGTDNQGNFYRFDPQQRAFEMWRDTIQGFTIATVIAGDRGRAGVADQDADRAPPLDAAVEDPDRSAHQAAGSLFLERRSARPTFRRRRVVNFSSPPRFRWTRRARSAHRLTHSLVDAGRRRAGRRRHRAG